MLNQNCDCEFTAKFQWNCEKYYECAAGEMYLRVCPSGLHFDPITQNCDYASQVNCEETEACLR